MASPGKSDRFNPCTMLYVSNVLFRLDNVVYREMTSDWEKFFSKHATTKPNEVLVHGQPWGALEEMRCGSFMVISIYRICP